MCSSVQVKRRIAVDPLSPDTTSSVSQWLGECETNSDSKHLVCSMSEQPFIPSRLVEVDVLESQVRLRLVRKDDVLHHDPSRYVALSYCWGGPQEKQLTTANLAAYQIEMPWYELPKTLQDAAVATHSLGFRYVWIDSMCILQDDAHDKSIEISQMTQVYTHASLTIMAERGSTAAAGFLHGRSFPSGTSLLRFQAEDGTCGVVTLIQDSATRSEDNKSLSTRGWTMQEYLLSCRSLAFGTWHTKWSCRSDRTLHVDGFEPLSESDLLDPFGFGNHLTNDRWEVIDNVRLGDALMFISVNPGREHDIPSIWQIYNLWDGLVQEYSRRSLSDNKDRVLAISGLAERFSTFLSARGGYVAGNWEEQFPQALLWWVAHTHWRHSGSREERPTDYQGPSWSWVSINEAVFPESLMVADLCKFHSIHYKLADPQAPFGAVRSAEMLIEGPALDVQWRCIRNHDWLEHYRGDPDYSNFECRWSGDCKENTNHYCQHVTIAFDALETETDWTEAVFLACRARNPQLSDETPYPRGLVLMTASHDTQGELQLSKATKYRRVGVYSIVLEDQHPLPGCEDSSHFLPAPEEWPVKQFVVI